MNDINNSTEAVGAEDTPGARLFSGNWDKHPEIIGLFLEKAPIAVAVIRKTDQELLYQNPKWFEMFGYDESEVSTEEQWLELAYPDRQYRDKVSGEWATRVEKAIKTQAATEPFETVIRCRDGSRKNVEWGFVSTGEQNIYWGVDRTERHRFEAERSEMDQKFRLAFENANIGVCLVDLGGRLLRVNNKLCEMLDYTKTDLEGSSVNEKAHPDDLDVSPSSIHEALIGKNEVFEFEKRFISKHGKIVYTKVSSSLARDHLGNPLYFISHVMDISDSKRAEQKLRQSEERFRLMFEKNNAVMLLIDPQSGLIVDINDAASRFYGYDRETLSKMNISQVNTLPRAEIERAVSLILSGEQNHFIFPHLLATGETRTVELYSTPIELEGKTLLSSIIHDITDRLRDEQEKKELQAQLFQSQKMQALDTLVGGIAHDFNNMLQIITGYSELLISGLGEVNKQQAILNNILTTSREGADLVRKLLAFGRRSQATPRPIDLNDQIRRMASLISSNLPPNVKLEQSLTELPSRVMADRNQIDQMLINLASNASEAMLNGGILKISTERVLLNEQDFANDPDLSPGDYVTLTVTDTGAGMDKQTIERIFDPFYSTKPRGSTRGTGLGLSVVKGIAQQQGGLVKCSSELGKGSRFTVYFPALDTEQAAADSGSGVVQDAVVHTIMIVENNTLVAELEQTILQSAGYKAVIVSTMSQAVEIFRQNPFGISLVLLDPMMTGVAGKDYMKEMVKINPALRIVVVSSSGPEDDIFREIAPYVRRFVRKPCGNDKIIEAVRFALSD